MSATKIDHTRVNKTLLTIFLVTLLMYLGKTFLIPVAIAAFFSMLLFPVMHKLQRLKVRKPVAALASILLLLLVLGAIGTLLYFQTVRLEADLPRLEERIQVKTNSLQWLLYETTDLTRLEQDAILEAKKADIAKALFKSIRDILMGGFAILLFVFIVLTYTFFFLVYQQKIQNFLVQLKVFENKKAAKVMLARISRIIHNYLKGVLTVTFTIGFLYALGFWAMGMEHAILFALLAALPRIIPYFGSFLGIAFPIAFTLLTKDSLWFPVMVLLLFMVSQVLSTNILTPYITGSRVKLNPMAIILVILFGKLIWGIAGMILFVPLFATIKVILDEIPRFNPYAYVLGKEYEEAPEPS
ncbi:AI-2E family transporter [Pontibacter locisalis]|uniref:AI-2E family transporter n=1 Tax=Pontibacter locisalis TaxID=1719035 RepID=A0ABW5IHA2_9BACT